MALSWQSQQPDKRLKAPMLSVSFSESTAATFEVVAAPGAGNSVHIVYFELQLQAASFSNTITLKHDATAINGGRQLADQVVYDFNGSPGGLEMVLPDNAALNVTLSDAKLVAGMFLYYIAPTQ